MQCCIEGNTSAKQLREGQKPQKVTLIFVVWNQNALVKDPVVSVNRNTWSPDGTFIGNSFFVKSKVL